jgi:hypothetical protein
LNWFCKKYWLAWSKVRFMMLPPERRVRLDMGMDGRHLTFLLVSLYEAGYGVHVVGSPAVFRELICLRKSAPMPFVVGGKEMACGISISDNSGFNHRGHREHGGANKTKQEAGSLELGAEFAERSTLFVLDYDYFSGLNKGGVSHGGAANTEVTAGLRLASQATDSEPDSLTSKLAHAPVSESLIRSTDGPISSLDAGHSPLVTVLRAPYFMHPSVYHLGLHKSHAATRHRAEGASHPLPSTRYPPQRRRRFRLGFCGTHDREFYTTHYHFPGMNRFEILEVFLQKFSDRITPLRGFPRDWELSEIAVSIDSRGGDRRGKSFLSQDNYFEALRECDFVLSPPGWCMPVSHNLVESMFCGAIPITNGGAFMAEPLADGVNCLEFQDAEGLISVIERALAMDEREVARLRFAVGNYYDRFLEPWAFVESLLQANSSRILVNAEENSVPMVFLGKF